MHWGNGWSWSDWLAMSLMMVVFWGLVVAGVVYLVRTMGRPGDDRRGADDDPPERILEQRFARGEIDEDEFRRGRDALSTHIQ